jgi:hypothetical protein
MADDKRAADASRDEGQSGLPRHLTALVGALKGPADLGRNHDKRSGCHCASAVMRAGSKLDIGGLALNQMMPAEVGTCATTEYGGRYPGEVNQSACPRYVAAFCHQR